MAGAPTGDQWGVVALADRCSWCDLRERYGPWQMVYEQCARWKVDGTWAHLLEQVHVRDDSVGSVEWTVSVDSTISRAHGLTGSPARPRARKEERRRGMNWEIRHVRRLARRGGRPVPRRADHQAPLACDGQGLPWPSSSRPATSTIPPSSTRSWTPWGAPGRSRAAPSQARCGHRGQGVCSSRWDVADRCVEVLVVEPVHPSRGGEFATAAGPATRTEPAAGCSSDRGQPLTVMFELPLLW